MPHASPNRRFPPCFPPAVAGLLLLWAGAATCVAQTLPVPDAAEPDALFTAFAYNFCLFTTWPAAKNDHAAQPFVILVAGERLADLAVLNGRKIHRRPIAVRQLPPASDLPDTCDVLICNGLEAKRRDALLAAAAKRAILTMSREPGFCAAGGIVEFFLKDRKMRFRVSCPNMTRSGVRVQSRLLKLAVIVRDTPGGD